MRIPKTIALGSITVIALGLGVTGVAAVAGVPLTHASAGAFVYAPGHPMPDLNKVLATNGREGYVYRADLDEASGATALSEFDSPEDAAAWQKERGSDRPAIPVYLIDGRTVIGEFVTG